jgi:hypothetical protein
MSAEAGPPEIARARTAAMAADILRPLQHETEARLNRIPWVAGFQIGTSRRRRW